MALFAVVALGVGIVATSDLAVPAYVHLIALTAIMLYGYRAQLDEGQLDDLIREGLVDDPD